MEGEREGRDGMKEVEEGRWCVYPSLSPSIGKGKGLLEFYVGLCQGSVYMSFMKFNQGCQNRG